MSGRSSRCWRTAPVQRLLASCTAPSPQTPFYRRLVALAVATGAFPSSWLTTGCRCAPPPTAAGCFFELLRNACVMPSSTQLRYESPHNHIVGRNAAEIVMPSTLSSFQRRLILRRYPSLPIHHRLSDSLKLSRIIIKLTRSQKHTPAGVDRNNSLIIYLRAIAARAILLLRLFTVYIREGEMVINVTSEFVLEVNNG